MADPFVAEIRIYPFNFAPKGWAFCDGQLLPLSQNTALFSLLGTTYGGNGTSNFALPDLQGRAPVSFGQGPGLSPRDLGETGGADTVALLASEMPSHTHALSGTQDAATSADPADKAYARTTLDAYSTRGYKPAMASEALAVAGSGSAHNNMQPFLTLNLCIALQGIFPSPT